MQIHLLKLKKRKTKKTIGRGGKTGTYSGRGNKGQKSRSGASINPLFEGGRSSLIDRMKKKRGFKSVHVPALAISLEKVAKKIDNAGIIDIASLIRLKVIKKKDSNRKVKFVGTGIFKNKISVDKNILLSKGARKAMEKTEIPKKEEKSEEKVSSVKGIKKNKK